MSGILLIEDNPDDVALTLRAFRKNNIANDITVARDGQEALDALFGNGPFGPGSGVLPSLLLLDLKLPRISGLEVLRRIRSDERTRLQPVVILTSSAEDEDLIAGYQLGANSYVRKPVDFVEFSDAIRILGRHWLVINLAPPAPASP